MDAKKDNEIYLSRIYDAPVKLVWDAWTDPKKAAKWWGPRGFTITTYSKDLRPGGHWHYMMHGPDGTDYPNHTIYHEVDEHSKLVYDHGGYEDRPPLFRVTVTFKENKGKTHMDMTMTLATPEAAKEIAKFIKQAGGNATWDRLAEFLGEEIEHRDLFVLNRTFHASPETLFKLWTSPELLPKWLPPQGFKMEFIKADIRPGGSSFYKMSDGSFTMFGLNTYTELSTHNIAYTQQFCDEHGNLTRHAPDWPETLLVTISFIVEDHEHTRMVLTTEVKAPASATEMETFRQSRSGMTLGWTGSFDALESILEAK